ncbi:MAG: hypothetical protein FJ291_13960 [Planctomycetes bacterium]|nr:hypothetical protein [Planctomycetota bacterium]
MSPGAVEPRPLRREDLASCTEEVLRRPHGAKPAIVLVRWEGQRLIVKDFGHAPWLVRQLYGRWVVARESRIYRLLDGMAGVPRFRGRLDGLAFAVDYVDAPSLGAKRRNSVPAVVFERLGSLLATLHGRGIVHLDSHQRRNVLVASGGEPFLVDFASAQHLGRGWLSRRVLMPLFARADWLGLRKLKAKYCTERLAGVEARSHRLLWTLGWLWPYTALRRIRRILRRRMRRRR